MNKRKSLGRGLDALLSSVRPATRRRRRPRTRRPRRRPAPEAGLREVPVDLLRRGKYQPRVDMREESLAELAESIKAQGVVQPIVVRPLPNATGGETRIRDRRRRAPLASRADGGPRDDPGRHPRHPGRVRRGRRADREHPAREPESDRGGAVAAPPRRGVRAHARRRRRGRRPVARHGHEPAAAARAAAARARDARAPRARHGPRAGAARARLAGAASSRSPSGRASSGWSVRETEDAVRRLAGPQSGRRPRKSGGAGRRSRTCAGSRRISPRRSVPPSRSSTGRRAGAS